MLTMEKNWVFYFWLILLKKHQFIYGLPENKRYTYYYHVYVITQGETFQIVNKKNGNQDIYIYIYMFIYHLDYFCKIYS